MPSVALVSAPSHLTAPPALHFPARATSRPSSSISSCSKTSARTVLIFDVWHPDLSKKEVKLLSFLQTAAMKRDKRICDAQGVDADNFYAVIDKARHATPDESSIWTAA